MPLFCNILLISSKKRKDSRLGIVHCVFTKERIYRIRKIGIKLTWVKDIYFCNFIGMNIHKVFTHWLFLVLHAQWECMNWLWYWRKWNSILTSSISTLYAADRKRINLHKTYDICIKNIRELFISRYPEKHLHKIRLYICITVIILYVTLI